MARGVLPARASRPTTPNANRQQEAQHLSTRPPRGIVARQLDRHPSARVIALLRNAAIWARVTCLAGQYRGGSAAQPAVIPEALSASMAR